MGRYRRLSDPFLAGSRLPTCYDAKSMLKDETLASEPYRNEKIPNNRYIFGKKTRRTLNYLWQRKPSGWKQAKLREFDPLELGKLVILFVWKRTSVWIIWILSWIEFSVSKLPSEQMPGYVWTCIANLGLSFPISWACPWPSYRARSIFFQRAKDILTQGLTVAFGIWL